MAARFTTSGSTSAAGRWSMPRTSAWACARTRSTGWTSSASADPAEAEPAHPAELGPFSGVTRRKTGRERCGSGGPRFAARAEPRQDLASGHRPARLPRLRDGAVSHEGRVLDARLGEPVVVEGAPRRVDIDAEERCRV